jgi:hypothetical protein
MDGSEKRELEGSESDVEYRAASGELREREESEDRWRLRPSMFLDEPWNGEDAGLGWGGRLRRQWQDVTGCSEVA